MKLNQNEIKLLQQEEIELTKSKENLLNQINQLEARFSSVTSMLTIITNLLGLVENRLSGLANDFYSSIPGEKAVLLPPRSA